MEEHFCAFCQHRIMEDAEFAKEKVFGSGEHGTAVAYRRFHQIPFAGETSSCYEKYLRSKLADFQHVT